MRKLMSLLLVLSLLFCMPAAQAASPADEYEYAIGQLKNKQYEWAADAFEALGQYRDASRYVLYCKALAAGEAGLYAVAAENLGSLDGFLDSDIQAVYYAGLTLESAEMYEDAAKLLGQISLFRDVNVRIAGYPALINARDYRLADEAEKAGNLNSAYTRFIALGDYQDSAARAAALLVVINENAYNAADQAEQEKRYADAYDGFIALGDYKDSPARAEAVRNLGKYAKGMEAIASGNYKSAREIFIELGDYADSKQKLYALGLLDYAAIERMSAAMARFQFHEKIGVIDFANNTVAAPNWDSMSLLTDNCLKVSIFDNKNYVSQYGLINAAGKVLADASYYDISTVTDGLMVAAKRNSTAYYSYSYEYYLMDVNGKVLSPSCKAIGDNVESTSSYIYMVSPAFTDGLIRIKTESGWGFMDQTGKTVISCQYADALDFSSGLAAVKTSKGWGYINTAGEFVIEPQFMSAQSFNQYGTAEVESLNGWHVIDKNCEIVYFIGQDIIETEEVADPMISPEMRAIAKDLMSTYLGEVNDESIDNLVIAATSYAAAESIELDADVIEETLFILLDLGFDYDIFYSFIFE